MTQEEKELLLKDISVRLQYGLICSIYREDDEGFGWRDAECKGYFQDNYSYEFYFEDVITVDNIERLKPYLRPLSSMTDEEAGEYNDLVKNTIDFYDCQKSEDVCLFVIPIDWLNKKKFDYRGLILRGLAIEAPKDMYFIK
jgi:hypothetical protein